MAETILLVAKILGILFLVCKVINKFTRDSDPGEVINLMGNSLAMRMGNFSSKRTD